MVLLEITAGTKHSSEGLNYEVEKISPKVGKDIERREKDNKIRSSLQEINIQKIEILKRHNGKKIKEENQ